MVAGGGIVGNEFYAVRGGPAWHRKGVVFQEDQTLDAVSAFELSEGRSEVRMVKYPLIAANPDGTPLFTGVDAFGQPMPLLSEQYGLWRLPIHDDPTTKFFGVVGEDYENITNRTVCEAIDASGITKHYPVETMGLLDDGRAFFFTLSAGEWDIKGDPMKAFIFVREGTDGKRSFNIAVTDVRVVCTNTDKWAMEGAEIDFKLMHGANIKQDIQFYAGVLPGIQAAQQRVREMRTRLAEVKFTPSMAEEVFEAAWPYAKDPRDVKILNMAEDGGLTPEEIERLEKTRAKHEYYKGRVDAKRNAAVDLLEIRNQEIEQRDLAGTGHIVLNVVTELANYATGNKNTRAESILMGDRMSQMTRGFEKALALAN